jgi:hypothetical protein
MWKTVFLTLILLIASVLLIAETTLATPWMEGNSWLAENAVNNVSPEVRRSPELPQAKIDESQNHQQTTDSTTENQNPIPEKQPTVNPVRPQAANPYDIEAIEKYNQENYGTGN